MRAPLTFAVLFLVPLISSFVAQQSNKHVVEDKDYCFRLVAPGKDWRMLEEVEARKIAPDAVAGGMSTKGGFGFVIVEPVITADLEDMVKLLFDNMSVPDKKLTAPVEIEFQKEHAQRFQVEGTVESRAIKWDYVLVMHRGFVYQVICCAPVADFHWTNDKLTPFQSAFSFTEGEPHARQVSNEIGDHIDVGWEVRNQTFRSAVFGMEAAPEAPWRLLVGKELRNVLPDAHVGFSCAVPEIYVVLIAENVGAAELEAVKAKSFENLVMGQDSVPVKVLGHEVSLRQATSDTAPQFEYLCGITSEDATLTKILAWYPKPAADDARSKITSLLATTRQLDGKAREELIERLTSGPDVQNRVGKGWCVRRGVYEDFESGFRWTKPAGMWRMHAGDEAKQESEGCTLQFENEEIGLNGYIGVLRTEAPDIQNYLEALAGSVFADVDWRELPSRKLQLGDAEAVTISGLSKSEIPTQIDLTVAVTKDRVFHMIVAGTVGQMQRAAARVDAARGGLQIFAKANEPVIETEEVTRDERLGFTLSRPADGWKRTHPPMKGAEGQGSSAGWAHGKESLYVIAFCPDTIDPDPHTFVDLVKKLLPSQLARKVNKSTVHDTQDFAGAAREHSSWKDGDVVADIYFVVRDRACYLVCTEAAGHALDRALAERCLTLLP
jgi:hypothetical protein